MRCAAPTRTALTLLMVVALASSGATAGVSGAAYAEPVSASGIVVGVGDGQIDEIVSVIEETGGEVERADEEAGSLVVIPPTDADPTEFAQALESVRAVRFTEPLREVTALVIGVDPQFAEQWNVVRIGAPDAWQVTTGTADVTVAVIDSGIDSAHPDLVGRVDPSRGWDFVDEDATPEDENGHGTHVAGIIAANTGNGLDIAGIADGVTLLPVRVLDAQGAGDTFGLSSAIRWAADAEADVINLSLGFSGSSTLVEEAVAYAASKGCLIVAASGNAARASLQYPAAYPDVVSVGATDADDLRAAFSQYGTGLDLMAPGTKKFVYDVIADGIWSLRPVNGPAAVEGVSTGKESGTSMSAPHVSAVAALVRSENPTWTARSIELWMKLSAEDLGVAGPDILTGYGLVRADRAVAPPLPQPDDDIPGVIAPTRTVTDIVDSAVDPQDVFTVEAQAGQILEATITGSSGADIAVRLYASDATSTADAIPLAQEVSSGESRTLRYRVPLDGAGTYRIAVAAVRSGGHYRLSWDRWYETRLTATAPSTCAWGGTATIAGRLQRSALATGLAGVRVVADQRHYGSTSWRASVASAVTRADGTFRLSVNPKRRTSYRVRFVRTAEDESATSASRVVTPRAYLTAPRPRSTIRPRTVFNVRGTLKPKHKARARDVRVLVYKRESGRWVYQRTVRAMNLSRSGSTRYSAWLWLPERGKYRFVARVPGDHIHVKTTSRPFTVRVR